MRHRATFTVTATMAALTLLLGAHVHHAGSEEGPRYTETRETERRSPSLSSRPPARPSRAARMRRHAHRPAPTCRASWYGPGFAGRPTASGESFDPDAMTAAHRTLPFGTRLVVAAGSEVVAVTVNDRGPFVAGRCLDLSRAAFARLAPLGAGEVTVSLRVDG